MRDIHFSPRGWKEYANWQEHSDAINKRIVELLTEAARTPFTGRGKPEPLKHKIDGLRCWSRRIDDENRLVYSVSDDEIRVVRCEGHY